MKLKIVSDGTATGTMVVNAETGEPLENVTSVRWRHKAADIPRIVMELVMVPAEAIIEVGSPIETTTISDRVRKFELREADHDTGGSRQAV